MYFNAYHNAIEVCSLRHVSISLSRSFSKSLCMCFCREATFIFRHDTSVSANNITYVGESSPGSNPIVYVSYLCSHIGLQLNTVVL